MNPCVKCGGPADTCRSGEGWTCPRCREKARDAARAEDRYKRCVHFVPETETWMTTWGTPEGRRRWIDERWVDYREARMRQPPWRRERSEAEARRVAARAYTRIREGARRSAAWEWRCLRRHACVAAARILGVELRGGGVREHLGAPVCDRQDSCKDYEATGDLVARSGGTPH